MCRDLPSVRSATVALLQGTAQVRPRTVSNSERDLTCALERPCVIPSDCVGRGCDLQTVRPAHRFWAFLPAFWAPAMLCLAKWLEEQGNPCVWVFGVSHWWLG